VQLFVDISGSLSTKAIILTASVRDYIVFRATLMVIPTTEERAYIRYWTDRQWWRQCHRRTALPSTSILVRWLAAASVLCAQRTRRPVLQRPETSFDASHHRRRRCRDVETTRILRRRRCCRHSGACVEPAAASAAVLGHTRRDEVRLRRRTSTPLGWSQDRCQIWLESTYDRRCSSNVPRLPALALPLNTGHDIAIAVLQQSNGQPSLGL